MLIFTVTLITFLVPDAIVAEPFKVPYIETEEQVSTDSAHAIAGQSANVNQPRVFGTREWVIHPDGFDRILRSI